MKRKTMIGFVAMVSLLVFLLTGCGLGGTPSGSNSGNLVNSGNSGNSGSTDNNSGNIKEPTQENPIQGVDIFHGERFNEMLWGYYEADCYEYSGSNSDADVFRDGMKYIDITFSSGNTRKCSALPLSIHAGSYSHFMGTFSYEDEFYEPYTELGRSMFRKAYLEQHGDMTEEQFQAIENLWVQDIMEFTVASEEGGTSYFYVAYKINADKLTIHELIEVDDYTIQVSDEVLAEYDFLMDGSKLSLMYEGVQRDYLPCGYKATDSSFSCSGYALNENNQYKDLVGFSFYQYGADQEFTVYVDFEKGESAEDPVMEMDTATGDFTITWQERWVYQDGNTVLVPDNGSISGKMVPCTSYGFTSYEGMFLFIDGQCYRYLMSEQEYKEKLYAGLMDSNNVGDLLTSQQDSLNAAKISILEALEAALAQEGITAQVDYNSGKVALEANFMFDTNSTALSAEGKEYLTKFVRAYTTAVLESDYSEFVSNIVIEGHTDTKGSYSYNKTLSEERAIAVSDHCIEQNAELGNVIRAEGCSYDYPVYNDDGTVNMEKSRRVTFRFVLTDY